MHAKISQLPEEVINKIAAGEVVENPASIVKELVENSLDAGARKISVEIVQGGEQLISVSDDGSGMSPEDALLCLQRHATSKIRTAEDLFDLHTMGFRGEALAAIAAVSHLELKTCDGDTATRLFVEGGKLKEQGPCARNQGTTIDVRFLFYNTPARKKFQKSSSSSAAQVRKIIETLALAHPEIAFSLTTHGKKVFECFAETPQRRIEAILGKFAHEIKGEGIRGCVASASEATPTRNGQYFFINDRPIFSPLVARAVKEGFGTRIPEHAYPPFVLFLDIEASRVDVNVHPQKREARFENESAIFRLVQKSVENAFNINIPVSNPSPVFTDMFKDTFAPILPFRVEAPLETPQELPLEFSARPLTVMGAYFLVQTDSLLLVDLQAAQARVLFESLTVTKPIPQALLFPLEIKMDADEEMIEALHQLGVECRLLKKTLVVDALPEMLKVEYFPKFLEQWQETKKIELASAAVSRLHRTWQLQDAMHLFRQVQKCRDTSYDPLGNPIWIELQSADLANMMSRKGKI